MPIWYSTADFEDQYTYTGDDLGAVWTAEKTTFRVWAPTADAVTVMLYDNGGETGLDIMRGSIPMTADVNGTWVAVVEGDLNGTYYTYSVEVDGEVREACDPYARTTGVNGKRAMVLDLDSTDPVGWENDKIPHTSGEITDAVIYELHVRDLSSDPSSGITQSGKFLGLLQTGTTNSAGIPTGLDHIKSLGVTHIHLLPSYDYASVDETNPEAGFNWGYDPVNYNVPEGSYSTDPYHGEVRVKEFKQMVQGLHEAGIGVILDVVYNHVYDAESFCFNNIVPGYFSRIDQAGNYSNGSICGNDTASERSMVRKYIVDSVKYWADEYHLDGFRFDLLGLIDVQTVNEVIEEVHKTHPHVIFYAEGWNMGTQVTKENVVLATQANSKETPGMAYFSDMIHDAVRGSNSNASKTGFAAGAGGFAANVADSFLGHPTWAKNPSQVVNYVSCHDGLSLFDRLTMSTQDRTLEERIRMNNLAAAIVMTSQGTPFFQAGEEMLRSKPLPEGGFDHNSYKSSDSINSIKWDTLSDPMYQDVLAYYTGLIEFRRNHSALRMTTAQEVSEKITQLSGLDFNVLGFHIAKDANGEQNELVVIFNPNAEATTVTLPEGSWEIHINGEEAGTRALATAEGTVEVAHISAMVLVKPGEEPVAPTEPIAADPVPKGNDNLWLACAAIALICGAGCGVILKRKK
ncbi:MAG: type I pullulanase [Oscillospiraceae bacterium]|nr:type I pullulanase [Oscillospiraceae bacterium]